MTTRSVRRRSRVITRRVSAALVALLAMTSVVVAGPSPAAATPVAEAKQVTAPNDFNGDGRADLAVAGDLAVHIIYGSTRGLQASGTQKWTPDDIPAVPTGSAAFAVTLATGDFNGDGYCDLAIADDGATVDGGEDAGAVAVIYGSTTGLTATGSQYLTRNTAGGSGSAELDDRFGRALAAADFGRGAYSDLAIASGDEGVGGAVHVLYGSASGLAATGGQVWSQASSGIVGAPEVGDRFGDALAAGDFNGNGTADLAVGVPQEAVGMTSLAGAIQVIFGSDQGLTAAGDQGFNRDSPGIKATARSRSYFGRSLAAGHFAGHAPADLAIGAWTDRSVSVIYGSTKGLTATGDQVWNKNSAGLPRGAFGGGDLLPGSLTAANFGSDPTQGRRDDLAVGVDGAGSGLPEGSGAVLVLYGARTGLGATGSELWSQDTRGVPGVAERRDNFGAALAGGVFDGGRYADLAIGSPTESIGHVYPAGSVHVVRGSGSGLQKADVQFWSAERLGDVPEENLEFGSALAASGS